MGIQNEYLSSLVKSRKYYGFKDETCRKVYKKAIFFRKETVKFSRNKLYQNEIREKGTRRSGDECHFKNIM